VKNTSTYSTQLPYLIVAYIGVAAPVLLFVITAMRTSSPAADCLLLSQLLLLSCCLKINILSILHFLRVESHVLCYILWTDSDLLCLEITSICISTQAVGVLTYVLSKTPWLIAKHGNFEMYPSKNIRHVAIFVYSNTFCSKNLILR
jgi:hypothetical protein